MPTPTTLVAQVQAMGAHIEDGRTRDPLPIEQPRLRAVMVDRLKKGYPLRVVLRAAGISPYLWRQYRDKGERGVEPYASCLHEIEVAQAEGMCDLMDDIRAAGRGAPDQHGVWKNKWEASRYLLEVSDPSTFKSVEKSISLHGEIPAVQVVDMAQLSDADLDALISIAERAPTVVDVTVVDDD